jgi:lipopolysaccharide export system protein LptA
MTYDREEGIMNLSEEAYIDYGTISANANQIRVIEEANRAVLRGNVSGQQNGNNFQADQIEILDKGNKIEMTGSAQLIFNPEE